jgi:hypothetical protein
MDQQVDAQKEVEQKNRGDEEVPGRIKARVILVSLRLGHGADPFGCEDCRMAEFQIVGARR